MDVANFIDTSQLIILFQIILIDLVLAADNAIIIGMIASSFPAKLRKKILVWGVVGAVIARVIFALMVAWLLQFDGLKLIGGIILLWVCYRLYKDVVQNKNKQTSHSKVRKKKLNFFGAVMTILIADLSLSLDNVLGVAGAAKDHFGLLVFGLLLSIIMMATMANLISKWVKNYSWIAWLGLLAIFIVAVQLILADKAILASFIYYIKSMFL